MEQLLEQMDTTRLEEGLGQLFPGLKLPVEECLERLLEGDLGGAVSSLIKTFSYSILGELDSFRKLFVWLVILGVLSGLLSLFSDLFEKVKNTQYCYYLVFLSTLVIVLRSFSLMYCTGKELVENMLLFMRLLFPTYFIVVQASLGVASGKLVYQLVLLIIYIVEKGICYIALPAVTVYVLLVTLNGLWPEEKCKYMIALLEKVLRMGLRAGVMLVTGMGFLQSFLAPALWRVERSVLLKTTSMIPGVGNAVEGAAELVLGSALIIKNCVGIFLFLVLLAMCLAPLLRMVLTMLFMKAAASFMGLISEGKLATLVNGFSDAVSLLIRVVATALFLFIIALGFICAMGGASY